MIKKVYNIDTRCQGYKTFFFIANARSLSLSIGPTQSSVTLVTKLLGNWHGLPFQDWIKTLQLNI